MNTTETTHNRPTLAFYHPNAKGTGCAAKFALYPATVERDGYISLTLANQRTVGDRNGPTPAFPTFDWDGAIHVKLGFADLGEVLRVFRGEVESIADGKGIFIRTERAAVVFRLSHMVEPVLCYKIEVHRKILAGDVMDSVSIFLTSSEALGLCCAIEGSMAAVAFGAVREG